MNERKMSKDVNIHCPLCRVPMNYTLKKNVHNPKTNQVVLVCPKCGNDVKTALNERWLKH